MPTYIIENPTNLSMFELDDGAVKALATYYEGTPFRSEPIGSGLIVEAIRVGLFPIKLETKLATTNLSIKQSQQMRRTLFYAEQYVKTGFIQV